MKIFWDQGLTYRQNYGKLLNTLYHDNRPWIKDIEPPKDGTRLYFLCQSDYKGDPEYDVGYWDDYTNRLWFSPHRDIGGEWNTEFGNCEEILGWKVVL